jgi:hypothetical protein
MAVNPVPRLPIVRSKRIGAIVKAIREQLPEECANNRRHNHRGEKLHFPIMKFIHVAQVTHDLRHEGAKLAIKKTNKWTHVPTPTPTISYCGNQEIVHAAQTILLHSSRHDIVYPHFHPSDQNEIVNRGCVGDDQFRLTCESFRSSPSSFRRGLCALRVRLRLQFKSLFSPVSCFAGLKTIPARLVFPSMGRRVH